MNMATLPTGASLLERARAQRQQQPQAALGLVLQATAVAADEATAAAARLLCAELQLDLSDYEAACASATEALARHEALADPRGRADSHDALGRGLEKLGRNEEALQHHGQALALSNALGDESRASRALLCQGVVRYQQSDFPAAVAHYRESLDRARGAGDAYLQARALGCLGNAHERMGDYARALEFHQQCLARFDEQAFPRERSFALNNIANVYLALQDPGQALHFHEQSLVLKRRLQDRWGECTSLQNLGICCMELKEPARARSLFEESLVLAESIGDREGIAVAHQGLGELAAARGDLETALHSFHAALEITAALGQRYEQVVALQGLGQVYRHQRRFEDSREALQRALELARQLQTRRQAQQVHVELSALCEEAGDLAGALLNSREAYRLEREVFNEDLESRLRHLKLHFELERAEQEKELHRLRHVELAQLNQELQHSNEQLAQANRQKEELLRTLERQKRLLQRQSTRDALTGLYNRRHFDQELVRAFRAAQRYGQPLSVVICDIDDFKKINDRFSHQTGDAVLRAAGRLLLQHCRKTDVVARYGGEEFALLLTATPGERAFAVCEKMRSVFAEHPWEQLHPELKVTISMGISDDLAHEAPEGTMAQADQRLYRAKHDGKNRVVFGG